MAIADVDELDSQILGENVTFLNDCFDNSFLLENSLHSVREYIAEVQSEYVKKNKGPNKTANAFQSFELDISNKISTQCNESSKLLRNWGLPVEITQKYEEKGIVEMFDWQVSCLGNSKVLHDCKNLLYSAPTSAGKTLVAEILTIKTVLERQKKVIVILPFVSIVREKMFYLQDILSCSGIRVEGFMGSQSPPGGLQAVHIAICTIEKANSLLNRLLDENNISELGSIIVDELHLLGDPHRGYILELLLTKVKYITSRFNIQIQIVGMSATLPNLEELATWLDAELFITSFRPIPLNEFCLIENKLYDKHGKYEGIINRIDHLIGNDNILNICIETIKDGCSILIFCMTKNRCENLAQNIASSFFKLGCSPTKTGLILREELKTEAISEVLEQLKNSPVGLDQILKQTVSFGVAYHHAGLTFDERDIIEGAFKSGALRVLVATSTLSSGVNLPARKVIIRSPMFQRQPINILTYKQMIGRAGRMGKDISGDSILVCTEAEKKIGFELMMGTLNPVKSCIDGEDKYMRSMLEMIASADKCTKSDLELYSKCTLLYTQKLLSDNLLLESTLQRLISFELVRTQTDNVNECYVATALGKACLSSSMAPNDGLSLFCELQKARQCLVLETDLHLIYLVTPYSVSNQWSDIDWLHLLTLWESLTKAMKRVGELVGVQESFIICSLRSTKNSICPKKLSVHKRFYTALALQDLVNEVPLSEVAVKFQCARGFLQGLQQAAATFAGMVTAFCRQLGWKNMEMLISQFQDRLHFGIHSELIDLMKLPSLNSSRARALFDAGLESISNIASADINAIENIFHKAVPFQSEKKREDDDDDLDIRKRNNIKNIWITGYCGMTPREAANILILEARKYLSLEIGVTEIKWNNETNLNIVRLDKSLKTSLNVIANVDASNDECMNDEMINKKENEERYVLIDNSSENSAHIITDVSDNLPITNSLLKKRTEDILENKVIMKEEVVNTMVKNMSNNIEINTDLNKVSNNTSLCMLIKKENNCNSLNYTKGELNYNINLIKNEVKTTKENIPPQELEKCKSMKDESLWDTFSITETAIQNITKARSSSALFSPNLSLGEIETKPITVNNTTKDTSKSSCTSSKDISLFSSDGESSFLDESFSAKSKLDLNFLNNENKSPIINNYNCINSNNTLLNVFKSPIFGSLEEDDMKLIYEEENDIFAELAQSTKVIDNNEVVNTQENSKINIRCNFITPLKRSADTSNEPLQQQSGKKKKVLDIKTPLRSNKTCICNDSNHVTMKFSNYTLNCCILRGGDILRVERVIENIKMASMIIDMETKTPAKNILIGSHVLRNGTMFNNTLLNTAAEEKRLLKAVAICLSPNVCFYLDLASAGGVLESVKSMLSNWLDKKSLTLKVLALKTFYKNLKHYFEKEIAVRCSDVVLTDWLINSDTKLTHILDLAEKYCKLDFRRMELEVNNQRRRYKDIKPVEDISLQAWCILKVAQEQESILLQQYNSSTTLHELEDTETRVLKILANSELNGITVDKSLASRLLADVKKSQEVLQSKAFQICGYSFNFNSSKSVAKVLGLYKGRKVSTRKSVLTAHSSPLASIVIFWRKLNSILTKTLYPLTEQACIYSADNRITPSYTMFSCTGRVGMHEPNLQNVPRTFSVPLKYLSATDSERTGDVVQFNCRRVFRARTGHVLVSADYCQLEMRILTHYSADPVLMRIMGSDVDVFKAVASSWGGVSEEQVDDDLRQKAKQLCYGIIYGMGNKTLAQHLDVGETEAAVFMDTFHRTYPAIKVFTHRVLESCRATGYVETVKKRRRHLPDINNRVASKRGAAERQAINTMIQGSAADITKAAMCAIDRKTSAHIRRPRLVLQMHDELIYEVPEESQRSFVAVIKEVMEGAIRLEVPLPVKVKCGYTWGTLAEVNL